ncbi:hypothetical protein Q5P01_018464 [Channa striata]|uniref:ATPase inhibitor, mitochondrial n=1 Tax=Channa striata TaxID=64152 RepID=A0AA88M7T3_CHASR|nr:hypothetical protein Q5P01_018464 [Channa striata]
MTPSGLSTGPAARRIPAVMARLFLSGNLRRCITCQVRMASDQLGDPGKGAGKGGGGGGSVKEAGGAFGKRAVSEEERYFRQRRQEDIEALARHHSEEVHHHEKEILHQQLATERHRGRIRKLNHED